MTLEDYRKQYNGAPYNLYTYADLAIEIDDCEVLANAAKAYLEASAQFEVALTFEAIEVG